MSHYPISRPARQESSALAGALRTQLLSFLAPLLRMLDQHLDRRLVCTVLATIEAMLIWRHRALGLLLSELGGYLLPPDQAPAGTKRLSNLLRSPKWSAQLLADYFWQQAVEQVQQLALTGQEPLLLWDESEWEKPESLKSEGLCAVRSRKARRLRRIRPGFFQPPPSRRPICVAGLHWLGLLLVGPSGPPTVATLQWWTRRGQHATEGRVVRGQLLGRCRRQWGRQVRHVWDRGFATSQWLVQALETDLRFVLRWPKRYRLLDSWGELRNAWKIAGGKRTWDYRYLYDTHSRTMQKVGVLALPVTHPQHARPLWLVIARSGKGREPWYLLTSDLIRTPAEAWSIVLAYARRWQIELAWRYSKSELAIESPRLWSWERRERLLWLVTIVFAFLLTLLDAGQAQLRAHLLRRWCHRTGKRSRESSAPLYRLRRGDQSTLASLSAIPDCTNLKFGMTHVYCA